MKKWENAEISFIELSATNEDFCWEPERDGGYLGDGKFNGRYGKPNEIPATPLIPATPITPSEPDGDPVDRLS